VWIYTANNLDGDRKADAVRPCCGAYWLFVELAGPNDYIEVRVVVRVVYSCWLFRIAGPM
jgi:hypothetical protein